MAAHSLDAIQLTGGFFQNFLLNGSDQQAMFDIAQANGITNVNQFRDLLIGLMEGTVGGQGLNTSPRVANPDRVAAHADTFTVGAEREVGDNFTVGVDLIHTKNNNIVVSGDLNPNSVSLGGRPNLSIFNGAPVSLGSVGTYLNAGESTYNALQASVVRRLGDSAIGRYQLRTSYTYADQSGNAAPENVEGSNRFQTRTETGYNFDTGQFIGEAVSLGLANNDGMRATWHRDHNFVTSWAWIIPGTSLGSSNEGLMFSGVFRYLSGDRFTPQLFARTDNGGSRQRAPAGTYTVNGTSDLAFDSLVFDGKENSATRPPITRLDVSLRYRIPLSTANITVLFDAFNVTDKVNFNNPTSFVDSSVFLIPNSARPPREFQLGFRLDF